MLPHLRSPATAVHLQQLYGIQALVFKQILVPEPSPYLLHTSSEAHTPFQGASGFSIPTLGLRIETSDLKRAFSPQLRV